MLRTKSGLPKHCSWNYDRHGKRRVRFRKDGFSTYLTGTPWSEDFMREYAAALDGVKAQTTSNVGAVRTTPGSFNALCVSYYRSPEFRGLKASTQTVYRNIIERFRKGRGDKPLARLNRAHIKDAIGARADTPEAANNLLRVLRMMLNYAVSIDMIPSNPAAGVKGYRSKGDGFHTWSEAEIAQFEAKHPIGTMPRLALVLLLYTMQRRGDVVRMGWQHVKKDAIVLRQEKTDTPLLIPIHPELARALALAPRTDMKFLPFKSSASFGNWFRNQCKLAGLPPQCSAHGLRKAGATRLANAGCSSDLIKAMTGHKTLAMVARYTKDADQQRLARQALDMMQLAAEKTERTESEQKLSNLEARLDKTARK
jgi:integrase